MTRAAATGLAAFLWTGAALAHPSLVGHAHPHGPSALLGFDVPVGTAAIFALATVAVALLRRRR